MSNLLKPRPVKYENLTYRDIKKEAIMRGMPFDDAISSDFNGLHSYVYKNEDKHLNPELINDFDKYLEENLKNDGCEYLLHNSLRLGYIGERSSEVQSIPKKEKVKREPRPKREKTEEGIFKGTKKAYTFELSRKGRTLEYVVKRVLKRFPDASEKSIKIWYRKAKI